MQKTLSSSLLLVLIALIGIGLVQVYSSSYVFAAESFNDGLYFLKKQLFFVFIGIVVLAVTSQVPLEMVKKWGWVAWLVGALGVAATFVPGLGIRSGGALRWLVLPLSLRFEPSEFLKFSFSIILAWLMAKVIVLDQKKDKITFKNTFQSPMTWVFLFLLFAIPLLLLLRQPDFGSFAIIICSLVCLLFAFGLPWRYIIGAMTVILPAFYLLVMRVPYRKARIVAFLDPWADPEQKGFQVIQSMLSFHSGGLTGAGIGQGQGKLFFLPEAHTDFTLAVFGEEMGLIGIIVLMSLYAFIIFKGFQIALRSRDIFDKCLSLGITFTFGLSVFINSGVVMGFLPTKGLTMPFLSYGGSSIVVLCFVFGLLLNIEKSQQV